MVGVPGDARGATSTFEPVWWCGLFEGEISFRKLAGVRRMSGEMDKSEKYFLFCDFEAILEFEKRKKEGYFRHESHRWLVD